MSTISTHLNWGSSYISLDFYKRFVKPKASEKELVAIGRISTIVLMALSALLALALSSALSTFAILLQIGAGTGLIFILRWFWWCPCCCCFKTTTSSPNVDKQESIQTNSDEMIVETGAVTETNVSKMSAALPSTD